jgi:hypothetical protein
MARSKSFCPPGVFCISNNFTNIILVIAVIILGILTYNIVVNKSSPTIIIPPSHTESSRTTATVIPVGESRYDRAPQPLRDWMSPPEFPPRGGLASIPINIPTQGLPESFQSVGLISVDGAVWPLYGRRTNGSSDRWNYYTRTDTYNPVPVPVKYQRRDCMDQIGCNEILSGDDVKIDVLHKEGKAKMYKFDGPKYIPGLI